MSVLAIGRISLQSSHGGFLGVWRARLFSVSSFRSGLALLLVLNLWDAFFTLGWVHSGVATEANPVMARALAAGTSTFILGKVALVLLGVGMLWRLRDRFLARVAVVPVALLYAGVSGAHLGVALGYLTA